MSDVPDPLFTRVARALAAEYELIRLLGRGGMATVFLARELALKRLVAIKVLDPELGASPVFRTRFAREAETAAQLQHSNIVPIFRVGVADGVAYYAMGYVEGESLAERLQRERRLPLPEALRVAREVADALGAAHRRGIVHRDVKPQNILLERESGRALVTDFGIAGLAQGVAGTDADRLTAMGLVMGTPRYMSPEQAAGERDLTGATDLYSLGVVWYEMLTGAYPYRMSGGVGPMALPFSHPMVPVREHGSDVPESVAGLVEKLLSQDPATRPSSGEAVVRAIDAEAGTGAVPTRRGRRPLSRRVRWAAVGAAAFAVGLPLFLWFVRPGAAPRGVDPRKSLLIGFFENTTRDPAVEWLRVGGVELLSQSLKRWTDLQVVDVERLLDLARRVGVERDAAVSRDDAVRLARAAGVWTTTVGSLMRLGERVRITVRVYDVTTRRQLTQAMIETRPDSTLPAAFASLADQILDVAGAPRSTLRDITAPTRSLAAYEAYIEGVEARSRWDMPRALTAFRRAVAADSTFALAYYEWSAALFGSEFLTPGAHFVDLADSAFKYSASRPEKERRLIAAYRAWVHGELPAARALYRQVLVLDSTVTDAWSGLGDASWCDLTLVKDAHGRDSLPASFTTALRSYERALTLDESDHRLFASLASMIVPAAVEGGPTIPAYREPLDGPISRLFNRVPVRTYSLVYAGDTLALVPSESMSVRFPRPVLDSLRRRAQRRAEAVLDRWVQAAPNEGQPYLTRAQLRLATKDYDGALPLLDSARARGATTAIPITQMKLSVLLQARRLEQAVALADSMAADTSSALRSAALTASGQVNAHLIAGRLARAERVGAQVYAAARQRGGSPNLVRLQELSELGDALGRAAAVERLTRAELTRAVADFERRLSDLPDTLRRSTRRSLGRLVTFAAASVGDTALVTRWLPADAPPGRRGAAAWAFAVAGDRAAAERMFAAATGDTSRSALNAFALARAAELLRRPADALRHYTRLDSLEYAGVQGPDPHWLLLVRSYPGRAAMYQALGDTVRAREYYRRFVALWSDADDVLRPEVEKAQRALGIAPRRESN